MTSRRWHPASWLAIGLTVAGMAIFVRLGVWQLDRAEQARAMLSAFAQAPDAALEDFARISAVPPEVRYPHVRVAGHFVGRGYLRDEQVRDGKLGVEVIDAFAVDGNASLLLVNRGWISWSHVPGTRPPLPPLALGDTLLSGVYAPFPGGGIRVGGNALPAQAAWPKLTLAIDPGEISADLGAPLLPRMLQLDADATSGFVRTWTPALMPPARHQAYAFQWFAFAFAAAVIFVVLHWKKAET
jgi:cytochrome oxidase assembly protein ShyY1